MLHEDTKTRGDQARDGLTERRLVLDGDHDLADPQALHAAAQGEQLVQLGLGEALHGGAVDDDHGPPGVRRVEVVLESGHLFDVERTGERNDVGTEARLVDDHR
ncbi:hypothetical protein D3C86_1545280 [compost metagenome]